MSSPRADLRGAGVTIGIRSSAGLGPSGLKSGPHCPGGVAERSNAAVLKTAVGASSPWVRIPPPPQAGVEKAALVACAPRPRAERLTLILTLTGVPGHDAQWDTPRPEGERPEQARALIGRLLRRRCVRVDSRRAPDAGRQGTRA